MEVIPGINCLDSECVAEKVTLLKDFDCSWVQFDVVDGKFAPVMTWNKSQELKLDANIEVDLMVERPEDFVEGWLKAGAKRLIVHLETLEGEGRESVLGKIVEKCSEYGAEIMMALEVDTPVEKLLPYLDSLLFVQFLAVKTGFSGQQFNQTIIEKIKFLKERAPDIQIEIDGGINPETAKLVKEAGADIIVSTSYIFNSQNPQKAYTDLIEVAKLPNY